MSANATQSLRALMAAMQEHLEAVVARRGPDDAAVDDAYEAVAIAFEKYEDVLDAEFGESLPIVLDEDDELDADLDEELDPHAVEDEDELDDDIERFDLR